MKIKWFRHGYKGIRRLAGVVISVVIIILGLCYGGERIKTLFLNNMFYAAMHIMMPFEDIYVIEYEEQEVTHEIEKTESEKETGIIQTIQPEDTAAGEDEDKYVTDENKTESILDAAAKVINKADLINYDFLIKNYYVVQGTTSLSEEVLSPEELYNMNLTIEKDISVPQILIFHTHGQEHFADYEANGKTIVDAGEYLAEILRNQYGFNVIHLTESFDYIDGVLDRSKAYEYANRRLDEVLMENPSIQVVIDLHRDGVDEDRHLVTNINNKPTAKIMLLNGVSYSNGIGELTDLYNPYLKENLAMTYKMFIIGKVYYPDLFRCIYISDYRYCLYHVPRSMLVEAGAQTNTYEEVYNAMEPLAHMINLELICE